MQPPTPIDPSRDLPPQPGEEPRGASADAPAAAGARPRPPEPTAARALLAAAITTAAVTAVSHAAPTTYAGTLVGLTFLAATFWLVLRYDEATIRAHGLSLGGLLEPVPLSTRRLARAALHALAWAALVAAIVFPPFWLGYRLYWDTGSPFVLRPPHAPADEIAAQLLVVALPEEAFFRGYLQSALDRVFPPRLRVLGAQLGPGWLVASAIFALGHLLTILHPARLAVFFPSLIFGWLRARTGGIGAPLLFHAACNLFSLTLARGYGLAP
ncbi:myxosortase MrtC [Sorangium cellulosum]|uniref:myxosortase MrtC n=1 Tax=Sorangium cellulosum TaxID=56 RepID=UPI0013EBF0B9|nr:MrtC family glutamic-type intramembrane protease [Sorangium cellulosum]